MQIIASIQTVLGMCLCRRWYVDSITPWNKNRRITVSIKGVPYAMRRVGGVLISLT